MSDTKIVIDSSDVTKATANLKDLSAQLGVTGNIAVQAEGAIRQMANALKAANANPLISGFVLLAAAVGGTAIAAKGMFDSFVDGAAKLNNLSKQTGLTVEELSIMQSVAKMSGTSMDTVTNAVLKFEKALAAGGKETSVQSRAFKELGINTSDTSKTTEQYMAMAAQKLEGLKDGWQKNNIVMALFGKTGTEINEFLSDYANKGDKAAKVTAEQAEMAEHYERSMRTLSATSNQYKMLIGSALLPVATALVDEFLKMTTSVNQLDKGSKDLIKNTVADWAFNIARGLAYAIGVGETFWNMLKGMGLAIGTLIGGVVTMGDVLGKVLAKDFAGAWDLAKTNVTQFQDGMSTAWKTFQTEGVTAITLVDKAAETYRNNLNKTGPVKPDGRTASNIGEGDTKPVRAEGVDAVAELLKQKEAILKLNGEYLAMYGVREATATQLVQLAIDEGKFNKVKKDGVQLSQEQVKAFQDELLANAGLVDLEKLKIDILKRGVEYRKQRAEVAAKGEEAKADYISAQVLQRYGATNTEAAIKVKEYQLALAEATMAKYTDADAGMNAISVTNAEMIALKQKIALLKAEKSALNDRKGNEEILLSESRTFSFGWEHAFGKYKDDATDAAKQAETIFGTASKGMEDMMVNFAMTGKLSFASMAQSILADIARIAARKAITSMFAAIFGSADGNVFGSGGAVLKSADGNIFDKPTLHGYSGGIGMLGEAGPEAIMPLSRGPNGKLGVVSQGGGAQVNNISVSVSVQGGNTNEQTGNAVAAKITEQFTRGIVRQELMAARRTGGMLNPI
jgi:lambda family phage tail tape measure protein